MKTPEQFNNKSKKLTLIMVIEMMMMILIVKKSNKSSNKNNKDNIELYQIRNQKIGMIQIVKIIIKRNKF